MCIKNSIAIHVNALERRNIMISFGAFLLSAVSVNCSKTAEVGQSVTLNCTINWNDGSNCSVSDIYTMVNKSERIQCNSSLTKHICKGDRLKYVSVTVPSVTKEVNVTVEIRSDCGMAKSHPVQLFPTAG